MKSIKTWKRIWALAQVVESLLSKQEVLGSGFNYQYWRGVGEKKEEKMVEEEDTIEEEG
jgi:hypothetical protein